MGCGLGLGFSKPLIESSCDVQSSVTYRHHARPPGTRSLAAVRSQRVTRLENQSRAFSRNTPLEFHSGEHRGVVPRESAMGNFDAFVDEDDDTPVAAPPVFVPMQASVPVPVPTPMYTHAVPMQISQMHQSPAPAVVRPPAPTPQALGMVDLLAACARPGKCTPDQLHALKVTYMKLKVRLRDDRYAIELKASSKQEHRLLHSFQTLNRAPSIASSILKHSTHILTLTITHNSSKRTLQERLITVVDFLKAVRDVLGEDELVRAMAQSRVARQQQAAQAALQAQAQAEATGAKETAGEAGGNAAGNSVKDSNKSAGKDVANSSKNPPAQNLDVAKEANDVLAIAGVNADEEARYMFGGGDDSYSERADLYTDFTPKSSWRKLIELRVFARVAGEDGLANRNGVPNVNEKVYEFVEEALQARLKGFIASCQSAATKRNDPNRNAFEQVRVVEPKALVRKINVDCEKAQAGRAEKERQALLRVGETFLSKRRRARGDDGDDAELKEKVAKVQAEEEERVRAETANQAAQAALGSDAKYLKWAEAAKSGSSVGVAKTGKAPSGVLNALKGETDAGGGMGNQSGEKFGIQTPASMTVTAHSMVLKDCAEAIKDDVRGKALRSRLLGKF